MEATIKRQMPGSTVHVIEMIVFSSKIQRDWMKPNQASQFPEIQSIPKNEEQYYATH